MVIRRRTRPVRRIPLDAEGLRVLYGRADEGNGDAALELCRRIYDGEIVLMHERDLHDAVSEARDRFLEHVELGTRGLRAVQELDGSAFVTAGRSTQSSPAEAPSPTNDVQCAPVIVVPEIQRAKVRKLLLERGYLPRRSSE